MVIDLGNDIKPFPCPEAVCKQALHYNQLSSHSFDLLVPIPKCQFSPSHASKFILK